MAAKSEIARLEAAEQDARNEAAGMMDLFGGGGDDHSATTEVSTTFNLDSRKVAGEDLNSVTLAGSDGSTGVPIDYHYSNNFTAYDSLGNPRNVTVYYEKTGDNQWTATTAMDAAAATSTTTSGLPRSCFIVRSKADGLLGSFSAAPLRGGLCVVLF